MAQSPPWHLWQFSSISFTDLSTLSVLEKSKLVAENEPMKINPIIDTEGTILRNGWERTSYF